MPTLRIQLLGSFYIAYNNTPLNSVNTPRLQSLLAYLLLHRATPQDRQHLAFQFWPDSPEAQARANLRFFLHRLRRALPAADQYLHSDESTLQWRTDASFTFDVSEFELAMVQVEQTDVAARQRALEQAVTLYQGDLLPSCYDDWILPERERLRQMFVGTLERLALLLEQQGEWRAAITHAQRLLRYDPLHEETYRRLMRLHSLSGDRVGALRVYHTCITVLERELAVEPSAATRQEYTELLRQATPAAPVTPLGLTPGYARLVIPSGPPNNLPIALTSFIGRTQEKLEIERLITVARILTLTGPGGCGKTRLALEVAADRLLARHFEDGAWRVELAKLTDPALVTQAVASTLGAREERNKPLMRTLTEFLQSRHILLVLDDCEHLIDACVQLVEMLLGACPLLRILATSLVPLNVAGETVWIMPPLSLPEPPPAGADIFSSATQSEAVRLFVERAASVLPTFQLTPQNAAAVSEICRRLDGMPLAIELAAGRVKVLRPEQIAARLDDRFNLLTGGSRTALPRHQSLRAVMDWSYELLTPAERALFQRLAVFAGGFALEAVEAVCTGHGIEAHHVLELLSLLVDKSLVVVDQLPHETRYHLLETMGQYAHEKLVETSDMEETRRRHVAYFMDFAERGERELEGPQQPAWLERLEREHDNLRAALRWALDHSESETALRLCSALGLYWFLHGHQSEGRRWIEAALATQSSASVATRAQTLMRAGRLASNQGDYAPAKRFYEASLTLWRELGDQRGIARALGRLGQLDSLQGENRLAHRRLEESLAQWRELRDPPGIANTLFQLGISLLIEGDFAGARARLEESLKLFKELQVKDMIALALNGLGELARTDGDYMRAAAYYDESMALSQELGHKLNIAHLLSNLGYLAYQQQDAARAAALFTASLKLCRELEVKRAVTEPLAGLAGVVTAAGNPAGAVRLLAAASALHAAMGDVWWPADRTAFEQILADVRAQLDEATFQAAWNEGSAMTVEAAIEFALATASMLPARHHP